MYARPLKKDENLHELPYLEEDEINLLDYLIVLLRHKWLIMGMVLLSGLAAVFTTLRMPDIYRSEATIAPRQKERTASSALSAFEGLGGLAGDIVGLGGGGSLEKIEVVLKSRHLSRTVVGRHNLMPRLFEEAWDKEKKKWKQNPTPTLQDAHATLVGMMTLSRDRRSDMLTIQIDDTDPGFAKEMVDHYLSALSESLRKETLQDAKENQHFLRKQLEQVSDPLLKEKLYSLLAREIEKETFARAQKYYGFLVLDPPIEPDLNKPVGPNRRLTGILAVIVSFFVAVFIAFFLEYIHHLKTVGDPLRLKRLKNSLRLRSTKKQ